jgi:hypothetical protein
VPYSSEFLDRESNDGLLASLAELKPSESERGLLIDAAGDHPLDRLAAADVFRHNLRAATSRQDVWPQLLLLASGVFFCDVFVRRVRIDLAWVPAQLRQLRNRLLHREVPAVVATMARLRSRKAAVAQSIESQKRQLRFEPQTEAEVLDEAIAATVAAPPAESAPAAAAESAAETYTGRLLQAKKRIRDEQQR